MIKIDYISDLNLDKLEFDGSMEEYIESILPVDKSDILIIAGNLGSKFMKILKFLKIINSHYNNIFYVTGIKELCLVDMAASFNWNSFTKLNILKDILSSKNEYSNITLLDGFDNQRIVLEEYDLSISGLSMFWDYSSLSLNLTHPKINELYKKFLKEYDLISFGKDLYTEKLNRLQPSKFFKNNFKRLDKLEPVDIMVTSYCPIKTKDNFKSFDGEYYIKKLKPKVWIFGGEMLYEDTILNHTKLVNAYNVSKKIQTLIIEKD